uniref:Uncharacterized protein n=1 Tax=Meloidogyne enterolobii TaxID=390850 RepID=A0A6V7V249_MELEN|nr:unnamed protein product [Meloidogyne enterolobii]
MKDGLRKLISRRRRVLFTNRRELTGRRQKKQRRRRKLRRVRRRKDLDRVFHKNKLKNRYPFSPKIFKYFPINYCICPYICL